MCASLEGLSSFVVNFAKNIFRQAFPHFDCNMCEVPELVGFWTLVLQEHGLA